MRSNPPTTLADFSWEGFDVSYRSIAVACVAASLVTVTGCSSGSSAAHPSDPCTVLSAERVASLLKVNVDPGTTDPLDDVYGRTCRWTQVGQQSPPGEELMVVTLDAKNWKEEVGSANGSTDNSGNTLSKARDTNVPAADAAYLLSEYGIDGPNTTSGTLMYVTLLARKGNTRLEIHTFVWWNGHQNPDSEGVVDEAVAQAVLSTA